MIALLRSICGSVCTSLYQFSFCFLLLYIFMLNIMLGHCFAISVFLFYFFFHTCISCIWLQYSLNVIAQPESCRAELHQTKYFLYSAKKKRTQLIIVMLKCTGMKLRKPVMPYANKKSADQPAQPHSLISTFVVCCLVYLLHPKFLSL